MLGDALRDDTKSARRLPACACFLVNAGVGSSEANINARRWKHQCTSAGEASVPEARRGPAPEPSDAVCLLVDGDASLALVDVIGDATSNPLESGLLPGMLGLLDTETRQASGSWCHSSGSAGTPW